MSGIEEYFSGSKLYGDDFSQREIDAWFEDEKKGYYDLGASDKEKYRYGYHALNNYYGYKSLKDRNFRSVLGIGSAYGDELRPIISKCKKITILEPTPEFKVNNIEGVPVRYVEPQSSGALPFGDKSFDLVTCFGVLHHIPNVTTVVNEIARSMENGGTFVVREPITSMGDWRAPRRGLTTRERGIPAKLFREIIVNAGFRILSEKKCMFPLTHRIFKPLKTPVYNSKLAVLVDRLFNLWPFWPAYYHATNVFQKLRFASLFIVAIKDT